MPPVPAPRRRRVPLLLAGGALVVAAAITLVLVLTGGEQSTPPASRMIAQYEYKFALPDRWTQTGGDPSKLRTEVKPSGAESGPDLVLVEQTRLAFDSDSDRPRALNKLRTDFDEAGESFSGFEDKVTYAGREVIHYQQHLDRTGATVDWYVLFKSHTQVSIGCQYTASARDTVLPACETIVRSMSITE